MEWLEVESKIFGISLTVRPLLQSWLGQISEYGILLPKYKAPLIMSNKVEPSLRSSQAVATLAIGIFCSGLYSPINGDTETV